MYKNSCFKGKLLMQNFLKLILLLNCSLEWHEATAELRELGLLFLWKWHLWMSRYHVNNNLYLWVFLQLFQFDRMIEKGMFKVIYHIWTIKWNSVFFPKRTITHKLFTLSAWFTVIQYCNQWSFICVVKDTSAARYFFPLLHVYVFYLNWDQCRSRSTTTFVQCERDLHSSLLDI